MEAIQECPCCGERARLKKTPGVFPQPVGWYVECKECGLRTTNELTIESAIRKWNMRKGER